MAQPTTYTRQADFTSYSSNFPAVPQSGTYLDAEFNAILTTLNGILTNLAILQEDDTTLKNRIVDPTSLATATLALISGNFTPRGDWADATAYAVGDLVNDDGATYVAHTAHTSSGSLDTSKFVSWAITADAEDIGITPAGSISSTDVQAALEELDTDITNNRGKFKVSSNDTTPDEFEDKISAGAGITFTVADDGADETLTISIADDAIDPDKIKTTRTIIGSIGGGTQDIDLDTDVRTFTATVDTATTTFTFSNPKASGNEDGFILILTNGGSQTVNWPASVDWAGGSAPTLTASGVDVLVFETTDGGATWYGFVAGLDMS